jgi:drug/metabolite transporter (DMT)-like permease
MSNYAKGLWIVLLGVVLLSPDSILVRLADADTITIIFYRGVFFSFWAGIILIFTYKKKIGQRLATMDRADGLCVLCNVIGSFSFVLAISYTTIAKALLIISISPVISAILSYIFLSEKISITTLLSIAMVFFGFYIIFYEGEDWINTWFGNLNALISAFLLSIIFVISRRKKKSMLPAMFFGGIFVAILTIFFSSPIQISSYALLILFIQGFVVASAFALLTLGPKYIPATEVSLMMLLETVFSILLAWWILREMPTAKTLAGGALILTTLIVYSLYQVKSHRA